MKISIILQFPDSERQAYIRAFSERQIDFFNEPEKAARCTISFAAVELKEHLSQCLENAEIAIRDAISDDVFVIRLFAKDLTIRGENYALIPEDNGLRIEGDGRVGVLYGVYELLKMQGFFWHEPGTVGTFVPERRKNLVLPKKAVSYSTNSVVCRGFCLDGQLNESEELALWMARNRLNSYACRPNTHAFMHKLGFILRDGGHIFESILHPDHVLPSGRTIWQEHPEWYGTPEKGEKSKERAQGTQFCVSQPDLLEYLSETLLRHIMDEWRYADEISVWGFDTWGSICHCEKCRELGNGTDQTLHMASYFRTYLNKAKKEGRLNRDIKMVLCAYEGTSTLLSPTKPVPQNLIDAGDYWLYATIVRCYAHAFDDEACSYNKNYAQVLKDWNKLDRRMPIAILEYYNVSKFEDLPLLFSCMQRDFRFFEQNGIAGFNYMHIPMVNWGVRALTQLLFAELSYHPTADTTSLIDSYFEKRYGPYKDRMRQIYAKIDGATAHITSWRAWKTRSILYTLQEWNGAIPDKPLKTDEHFGTPEQFESIGEETIAALSCARTLLEEVIREEKYNTEYSDLRKSQERAKLLHCLNEDRRGLIYGEDTFRLMLRMGQYYNALYNGEEQKARCLWNEIENLEQKMEGYYVPATYSQDYLALISKDALTRTQLRECIARCRRFRIENRTK
jgi:hypothetical protein